MTSFDCGRSGIQRTLVHMSFPKVDNDEFDRMWNNLSQVLLRHGVSNRQIDNDMNEQRFPPMQVMSKFVAFNQQVQRDVRSHYTVDKEKNCRALTGTGVLLLVLGAQVLWSFVG